MTLFHSKRRQILSGSVLLVCFTMLVACQKALVLWPNYLQTHYKVIFDWTDAPKANPSVMHFIAYPMGGGQGVEFGFTKNTGGEIDLTAGEYQSLSFNSDRENHLYRGNQWDSFEIYTPETSLTSYSNIFATSRAVPRGDGSENEPVVEEPDMLWTGSAAEMPPAGSRQSEEVTLRMQPSVFTYRFVIGNVANLEFITDIMATLSGMSESIYPCSGKASDTRCIIPVPVKREGELAITCSVRSFGHCPQQKSANHHLVVYARLSDGSPWYYDFDVTDKLHEAIQTVTDDEGNVLIVIYLDELPFPSPVSSDSGLHPSVEDWNEVNVDIKM